VFDLAQKKQIDFVIFTKRDRVARDQWVFQSIMKQLNDASVKVFYSEEKLTGDIAMDNFMGSTIVGFAAWEREQIKLRTNAGKRQHVRENKWPFSSIPYGYKKNTKKELELYQPEAEIAKSIIESYLNDKKSIYRIFEDLNNAHIPPPTYSTKQDSKQEGNKKLRKNATPYWCFSSVRRILRNAVVYS
jgi:DNA invertase Pin-like site-specific DNA recombinase